jgi:NADH dehydrogenase
VQVHEKWPELLAEACSNTPSVERLIHVSCLGADVDSPSPRLASKARGEVALQQAFPDATIMRCGPLVGVEDRFYTDLALWRFSNSGVPVIDGGMNKVQPVYVVDVAEAIYRSLEFEEAKGSTFELGGPSVVTCAHLHCGFGTCCDSISSSTAAGSQGWYLDLTGSRESTRDCSDTITAWIS